MKAPSGHCKNRFKLQIINTINEVKDLEKKNYHNPTT